MMASIALRSATCDDSNFILNSWLSELRTQIPFKFIHYKTFNIEQTKILQSILNNSLIIIACNPECLDQIYGYIVFEKVENELILHFIYVKLIFRNNKIGQQLLQSAYYPDQFGSKACAITYLPRYIPGKDILKLLQDHKLFYDPYLLYRRIND